MGKKIDITPPMGIYETFKNYNYKTGSALAEFLDNSIESFRANWKTIENSPEKNIIIIFDNHNKELYVYDTAFGIHEKDYERVLKLKAVPQNTLGLNEFGMGLKTAAFWFGKNLEVISRCRSNENLDFQNGVKLGLTQTNIKEGKSHIYAERFDTRNSKWKLKYGTVVKISGVDRDLSNSIAKKCSSLISRQYKKDIRNKGIKIHFYTKEQSEDKFLDINYWSINNKKKYHNKESLLDGKFLEYPKEEILVYKNEKMQKKVNFEVPHKDIILKVHGELFIRKKGSRPEAGIDLFRRDRIIINKCTDFIPEQSSFEYQRINGFLNLDNFIVTQAKDNFDWEGELFNKVYEEFHKLTEVQELISFARKFRIRSENSQKNIEKKIAKFTREKLFHDPNVETFNLKKIKDFANENDLKYSKQILCIK